ncbi:hypothetical protein Q4Q35_18890 [Flavivirga aquimarina]|uniref:DUF4468 domain-containing protein n=1 Tax=Flavivirga aquimarina TaxID=2027862 RepID=A0ABT8WFT6_9FLAO|nr:hypothetical protein [Flavivirga aquimarina]MDO5971874.1 hypothetical protein [Flavivirga aquimarina]
MRFLTLILILLTSNLFGQNKVHPYNRVESEFDKLLKLTIKTDSIINSSDNLKYQEKYITTGISEGSIQLTDSLGVEIGNGGFSTYTFRNDKTKEIIKAKHNTTVHYKYDIKDSLNANTERIEISIYYKNEKAYFAIFNEYHYDNENIISTNKYYVELNAKREDVFYSNGFQEKMRKHILTLSEEIKKQT